MPFPRANRSTLLQQTVNYIQSAPWNGNGTVPLPNSLLSLLSQLQTAQIDGAYGYLDYISLQCVPWTAEGEYLEGWAALRSIIRNIATYSSGSVSFTGTSGVTIPAGTIITTPDSNIFTTQADFIIGTTSSIAIQALTAGSAGNYASSTAIALKTSITGVTGASLTTAITGGTDAESDASLRNRMLQAYQTLPTGGSQNDFVSWGLAVPGVTRCWCDPAPPSQFVTIYPMFDITEAANGGFPVGTNGGATLDNRSSVATGDQLVVANYLWDKRPVCSAPVVTAPIAQHLTLRITPLITSNATTQANIVSAIQAMLLVKGTPLGMTVYESDLTSAIASVADVTEFVLQGFTSVAIPVSYLPVCVSSDISWT